MNTVPMIVPGSITGITAPFPRRPVFFVNLNNSLQPGLVVKAEPVAGPDAEISAVWSSKLMKNVNNRLVNTKVMTAAELAVFMPAAQATVANGSNQSRALAQGNSLLWVKMPFVPGVSDADFYTSTGAALNLIKANIKTFSDPKVWKELGKIVAVDIFNGNSDRFELKTGRWANQGNIMFTGGNSVIGLDTFDSGTFLGQNASSNLNSTTVFPELQILKDRNQQAQFALKCVRGVATEMRDSLKGETHFSVHVQTPYGPGVLAIDVSTMHTTFDNYALDFEQGLIAGAAQLKQYLQAKVRQYAPPPVVRRGPRMGGTLGGHRGGAIAPVIAAPIPPAPSKTLPPGIIARMKYLGW